MINRLPPPRRAMPLAAALVLSSLLFQAAAGVTLKPDPGFGGTFVAGTWTPMRVLAENMADPLKPGERPRDVSGELSVTVIGVDGNSVRFAHPLELPAQSRKLVEIPVILPANTLPVRITMTDSKDRVVAEESLVFPRNSGADQRGAGGVTPTVLIEQDPNRAHEYPAWGAEAANVQRIALEVLPSDLKGYAAVRALVIRSRLSNKLEPQQLDALQLWVELGGTLIVIAANSPQELRLDPWLSERLPAAPDTVREATLEQLVKESGPDLVLVCNWETVDPSAETLLASAGGEALALRRRVGAGEIIALAVDPSGLSRDALEKTALGREIQKIFDGVVFRPAVEDLRARHLWSTEDVNPDFDVDLLPNRAGIILVIVAFVLVVGPLNFNYLRRIRRLELAWVTIPVLSILFFSAVYAFGVLTKGHRQFWASAEILHLRAGQSRGLLLWNASHFSPASRNYTMTPPPGGSILPMVTFYEPPSGGLLSSLIGAGSRVTGDPDNPSLARLTPERGYQLTYPGEQWAASFFQGEMPMGIEGTIDGSVLLLPENEVMIDIANNTKTSLLGAVVFIGGERFIIGDLQPGEKYSSRQAVGGAPVAGPEKYEGMYDPRDAARDRQRLEEENLKSDLTGASRPSSPFGDPFEQSVFLKVSGGANSQYPIDDNRHPQRRARLIARQKAWASDVKIIPVPDQSRTAGLVEVALPVRMGGTVQIGSSIGVTPRRLRSEVMDFDPDGASFATQPGQVASLSEGWIEFALSPPEGFTEGEFERGRLEVRVTGPAAYLLVRAFNFETGKWDVVYQEATSSQSVTRGWPGSYDPDIRKQWVNPNGNYVKIRVDSREPPKSAQPSGGMMFTGSGIELVAVGGTMTFKGEALPADLEAEYAGRVAAAKSAATQNARNRGKGAKP